jgi:hypothetical protein
MFEPRQRKIHLKLNGYYKIKAHNLWLAFCQARKCLNLYHEILDVFLAFLLCFVAQLVH